MSGRALTVTVLLVAILYFLRFGYDFGISDQDEFLPWLLHRLNPDLLSNDWFVGIQDGGWNVRSAFVLVLLPFAYLFPVWAVVLTVYAGAFSLSVTALFSITRRVTGSQLASVIAPVLILVLTPYWNLGGNEILNRMLVPSMLAWGIALWAVDRLLSGRPILSGCLLGVASWIQPLVGLQVATVCLLYSLVVRASNRSSYVLSSRAAFVLTFGGCFLATSTPALFPIINDYLQATGSVEASYVMTAFRNPHHYLPDTFPLASVVRFMGLLTLGLGALILLKNAFQRVERSKFLTLLLSTLVLLLVGVFGTSVVQSDLLTKLQLFKISVLTKSILLVAVAGGSLWLMPGRVVMWIESVLFDRKSPSVALGLTMLTIAVILSWPPATSKTLPVLARMASSEGEMISWVKSNTPKESVFAVPLSFSGFRARAERSIYVNFKAFPYTESAILEWYDRIQSQAPIERPQRGGVSAMIALDISYHGRSAAELTRFSRWSGVSHLLFNSSMPQLMETDSLSLVFSNRDWWIYQTLSPAREPY